MKFYQVFDPYYALIKATNKESAYKLYVENVADDEDGEVKNGLEEVERDFAIVMYSSSLGKEEAVKEMVEDIQSEKEFVMLIDGSLL